MYDWGTAYELELETERPEELKTELEALLTQRGVPFSDSQRTKFANFRHKTLI